MFDFVVLIRGLNEAYTQHAVHCSRTDRRRCHSTPTVHTTALRRAYPDRVN